MKLSSLKPSTTILIFFTMVLGTFVIMHLTHLTHFAFSLISQPSTTDLVLGTCILLVMGYILSRGIYSLIYPVFKKLENQSDNQINNQTKENENA